MNQKLLNWSKKYAIGIAEIDEQHKILVEITNNMFTAHVRGAAHQQVEHIIAAMIDYAQLHFKLEEQFMLNNNYSAHQEHKIEHQVFTDKVRLFFEEYKNGSTTIPYQILIFLRDWLVHHIQVSDKKIAEEILPKTPDI
jgi:hemerythrin